MLGLPISGTVDPPGSTAETDVVFNLEFDCPERRRDSVAALLDVLAVPPRAAVEGWIRAGRPEGGPFIRWLGGRFRPARLPRLLRELERLEGYDAVALRLRLRLEPSARRLAGKGGVR